jgi:hypothetical protein
VKLLSCFKFGNYQIYIYYYFFPNLLHASCFGMLCFTLLFLDFYSYILKNKIKKNSINCGGIIDLFFCNNDVVG